MNAFLVKYLMNIYILLTTVMLMQTAPTPKDHSTARVLMVILVMEWLVKVSDSSKRSVVVPTEADVI